MDCDDINQQINRDKCYAQWPHFPCYDPNKKTCHSTDGVQLFDPVGDVMDVVMRSYRAAFDYVTRTLGRNPPQDRRRSDRELADQFYAWGPSALGMVPPGTARRTRAWGPTVAPPIPVAGPQAALTEMRHPIIRAEEGGPLAPRFYNAEDMEQQIRTGQEILQRVGDTIQHVLRPRRIRIEIPRRPRLHRLPSEEMGGKVGRTRNYYNCNGKRRSRRRKYRRKRHKTRSKLRRKSSSSRKKRKRKYRRSRKR